jgi:short-subunit dehydrogenase
MTQPQSQHKHYAFITGAGSGIGAEVAKRLDQVGYHLIISGSNRSKLERLATELQTTPVIEVADLTRQAEVKGLCERLLNDYSSLDIAFINAGTVEIGDFADRAPELIDREIDINLRSALHLIHACIPGMRKFGHGHIIATSSIGGTFAMRGSSVYSATKFALRGFLSGLQQELLPYGVKVSGLYPGAIDTEMLRYEATNGGSPLNFLHKPKTVKDVGDAFMRTLKTGQLEAYIPYSDSISARLLSLIPWAIPKLLPYFEKAGEKGRRKFISDNELLPENTSPTAS